MIYGIYGEVTCIGTCKMTICDYLWLSVTMYGSSLGPKNCRRACNGWLLLAVPCWSFCLGPGAVQAKGRSTSECYERYCNCNWWVFIKRLGLGWVICNFLRMFLVFNRSSGCVWWEIFWVLGVNESVQSGDLIMAARISPFDGEGQGCCSPPATSPLQ